jgi:hypothetical protein
MWLPAIGVASLLALAVFGVGFVAVNAERAAEAKHDADVAQTRLALSEVRSTMDVILRARDQELAIDPRPKATGQAGQVEAAFKRFAIELVDDRRRYKQDLAGLGFPAALQPRSLAKENLALVAEKLAKARTVVEKYRDLNEQRLLDYRHLLDSAALSEDARSQFIVGYEQSFGRGQSAHDQAWSYEEAVIDDSRQLVSLLASHRGGWRFNGRQLAFSDLGLLAAYNAEVNAIRQVSASEAALRSQTLQSVDQRTSEAIANVN